MTDIEKPDVIGATRRAETIRQGMISYAAAMEAIGEAFENRDWVALGHKDWDTYCEKEFSEKRLKLTREQREQAVLAFRGAGMSTRAIAAALGVDDKTVRNDLRGAENSAPAEVRGADGKTYPATKTSPAPAEPEDGEEDAANHGGPAASSGPEETSGLGSTPPDAETGTNHQDGNPGEAEEFRGSSAADGVHPSVPQAVDDSSPEESSSADEPERPAAGVSPAAPDLVNTPIGPMTRGFAEQLDRLVPDPNPHWQWQKAFLDDVFAAAKLMRKYTGAEIFEKADQQLRVEFANLVADLDEKLRDVSKAQIAAGNSNVRQLRSVQ